MSDINTTLDCIKTMLADNFKTYLDMGLESADISQVKEAADAIKDLAQAGYYCKVTSAMEESEKEEKEYLMGYNPTGYNGRSRRMGYIPYMDEEPYIKDYIDNPEKFRNTMKNRMGYDMNNGYEYEDSYYDKYKMAKKHYTETHNSSDKEEMNVSTKHYLKEVLSDLKEMWVDADQGLRSSMKTDVLAFANSL